MYTLLVLLSLPFADDERRLASPSFREREAASSSLERSLPWSYAIALTSSTDPEVAVRKRRLLEAPASARFVREIVNSGGWYSYLGNWVMQHGDLRWWDESTVQAAHCYRVAHWGRGHTDEVPVYSYFFELRPGPNSPTTYFGRTHRD